MLRNSNIYFKFKHFSRELKRCCWKLLLFLEQSSDWEETYWWPLLFLSLLLPGGCSSGIQFCYGSANFSCDSQHGFVSTWGQEIGYFLLFYKVQFHELLWPLFVGYRMVGLEHSFICQLGRKCSLLGLYWCDGGRGDDGQRMLCWGYRVTGALPSLTKDSQLWGCDPQARYFYSGSLWLIIGSVSYLYWFRQNKGLKTSHPEKNTAFGVLWGFEGRGCMFFRNCTLKGAHQCATWFCQ